MASVTYALEVSYKLNLPPSWIRKWSRYGQPHPAEQPIYNDVLNIVRREPIDFGYDVRYSRREIRWEFRTSNQARAAERKLKRLRRAYPRLDIKTGVSVMRPMKDNINIAIDNLLSGRSSTNDVIEDLARTSAFYAAHMMLFNKDSKAKAEKKAENIVGIVPADDTLHAATVNDGIPKKTPTYKHVVKAGFYSPERAVKPHSEQANVVKGM